MRKLLLEADIVEIIKLKIQVYPFFDKMYSIQENTILYFWNTSCTVCGPLYDKLEQLVKDDFPLISIQKKDTATNPNLRAQYQAFSSPLFILMLDGKKYIRSRGSVSMHHLKEKISRLYQLRFEN